MNLLYASVGYLPEIGGAQIHLHELARRMAASGHAVRAVCQWSRTRRDWVNGTTIACDPPDAWLQDGLPVSRIGFSRATRRGMWPWAFCYRQRVMRTTAIRRVAALMQPEFAAAAASRPADVVHALRMGPEFLARAALDHSRRIGAAFVITSLHHPGWHGGRHRHYDRIFREADAVIALTDHEKRVLVEQKGVAASRVHVTGVGPVLHPDPDVAEFRARFDLRRRYVLFLGRKAGYKGWDAMLAAAPRVFRQCDDVDLVFAGEDDAASLRAFEGQHGPRVRNLGLVDLRTKTAALAGCEILCLPSRMESFGGVFTEAWSFGKPVIGGRIPPVQELIDDGVDGLLSSQRPGELAETIIWILQHPGEARRMGEAGRRKVETRFDWGRLTAATLRVYEATRA